MIDKLSEFAHFTEYFWNLRPVYKGYYIYEVDVGTETDYNVVMHASQYENDEPIGEPYLFIIAKEYFVPDFEKFCKKGLTFSLD